MQPIFVFQRSKNLPRLSVAKFISPWYNILTQTKLDPFTFPRYFSFLAHNPQTPQLARFAFYWWALSASFWWLPKRFVQLIDNVIPPALMWWRNIKSSKLPVYRFNGGDGRTFDPGLLYGPAQPGRGRTTATAVVRVSGKCPLKPFKQFVFRQISTPLLFFFSNQTDNTVGFWMPRFSQSPGSISFCSKLSLWRHFSGIPSSVLLKSSSATATSTVKGSG